MPDLTDQEPEYQDFSNVAIKEHALLVKRMAHHLRSHLPASMQLDDLIQAGMIGLLEAIKHYDASKGASFETYAGIRIRGHMLDEVRTNEWVPRSVYRHSRLINEAVKKVENQLGREASDKEIADELALDLESYFELVQDAGSTHWAGFEDMGLDENSIKGDGSRAEEPQEQVIQADMSDYLSQHINTLPDQEQMVVRLYYEQDLNLKQIGDVLEVSESRVSQIHSQAMTHLRSRLRGL